MRELSPVLAVKFRHDLAEHCPFAGRLSVAAITYIPQPQMRRLRPPIPCLRPSSIADQRGSGGEEWCCDAVCRAARDCRLQLYLPHPTGAEDSQRERRRRATGKAQDR